MQETHQTGVMRKSHSRLLKPEKAANRDSITSKTSGGGGGGAFLQKGSPPPTIFSMRNPPQRACVSAWFHYSRKVAQNDFTNGLNHCHRSPYRRVPPARQRLPQGKAPCRQQPQAEGAQHVQRRHRRIRHGGFPDPSPADGHFPEQQRAAPAIADGQMPRHDGGRVFRRDGLQ